MSFFVFLHNACNNIHIKKVRSLQFLSPECRIPLLKSPLSFTATIRYFSKIFREKPFTNRDRRDILAKYAIVRFPVPGCGVCLTSRSAVSLHWG